MSDERKRQIQDLTKRILELQADEAVEAALTPEQRRILELEREVERLKKENAVLRHRVDVAERALQEIRNPPRRRQDWTLADWSSARKG